MTAIRSAAAAALCAALVSPAAAQAPTQTVYVASFSYAPHPIHLAAGRPVTLNFVNRSGTGHDFTAASFFASSRILSGTAPHGEVELRGGETRSVTLIPRKGTYKAHCSHFMHKQFGMTDLIVVD
jgi:plastocyanin